MSDENVRERYGSMPVPVSRLAHDLLQPLRSIVVNVQRIQRRDETLSVESKSGLDEIVAAARIQEELIAGILEYDTALDESWHGNERAPLSLSIQAACLKIDAFRKLRNGTIRVVPLMPTANVDPAISKVLEKVTHNALKFHSDVDPPTVVIEAWEDAAGLIAIRVTDNGLGVEAKYRKLVFQPFERLNPSGKFPGAGMGLAICSRLIESIGGSIAFEDPAGSPGANVVIRFPVKEEAG